MDLESLPSLKDLNKEERHAIYDQYRAKGQYFCVEYCPKSSKAAKCRGCNAHLKEGDLRFRHLVCNNKCFQKKKTDVCGRFHVECFFKLQQEHLDHFQHSHDEWKTVNSVQQFAGYSKLKEADQEKLQDLIKKYSPEPVPSKEPKAKTESLTTSPKSPKSPKKDKVKAEESLNDNVKRVKQEAK
ncbi:hypothetical protein HK103_004997 [Boothiomyces macroporosus]|uniref:PARP-type domain-containing protein n=1 Tax=Boothiomyces macroporosus TaxID=261099 RepID=A0AAD5UGC6_9FUNG|nr:hypothetical protein HK103_004997 [Boothiomyces macroporosus]